MSASILPNGKAKRQSSFSLSSVPATRHDNRPGCPAQEDGQPLAAIYARVSTEDQGKGYSLPTQIAPCRQLLQSEGDRVPEHYVLTDTVSGTTLERPGLNTLRALERTQTIKAFAVYDPGRLSRILGHQLLLAEEADRAGVKLFIVSHPLEQGAEGWLFFQMRGALAEYERTKILERTRRGTVGRITEGHPGGGIVPLGYISISEPHKGRWEIDPETEGIVRHIFTWCVSGLPTRAIARKLTQAGILTHHDRRRKKTTEAAKADADGQVAADTPPVSPRPPARWNNQTVYKILTNPAYTGTATWGKHQNLTKTTRRRRPQEEWMSFTVPAIIDEATFQAAQEALVRLKAQSSRNRKYDYLLVGGRLRCGRCGRTMTGLTREAHLRYYRYTSASDSLLPLADRCRGSVRADPLEADVWAAVQRVLEQPDLIKAEVAKQHAGAEEQRQRVLQDITLIDAALAKCDREDQRWREAYADEIISATELKVYRADIDVRRQALQVQQRTCLTTLDTIGQAVERVESLLDYCARIRQTTPVFDISAKQDALAALNVRVYWTPGETPHMEVSIPLEELQSAIPLGIVVSKTTRSFSRRIRSVRRPFKLRWTSLARGKQLFL
jgi:site-specific DNA recombinase